MKNKTRILISYIKSPSKYGEALLDNFQKWVSESLNKSRLPDGTEAEIVVEDVSLSFAEKIGVLEEILGESSNPGEKRSNFEKNISQTMESEFSYTHTSDFRKIRIIECPYCKKEISKPLTMDHFIQLDMPYVYRVQDSELVEQENGRLILNSKCPHHPGTIALRRNKCYSRFIQPRGKEKLNDKIVLMEQVDRIEFI